MIKQQLEDFLVEEEFEKIPSSLPEFTIFYQLGNGYANVLHIIDCEENLYISEDQYLHLKDKIKDFFAQKNIFNTHILSLVITANGNIVKNLCKEDSFCWMLDPFNERLVIYENQVSDFYGIRERLEYWLSHMQNEMPVTLNDNKKTEKGKTKLPVIGIFLVAANIIIFLICTFTGDLLYNKGALGVADIIENKQYYRILTSMFLHWDINHLFGNMLILYFLGEIVEKYFGCIKYCIIYLLAGICGNLLSLVYEVGTGTYSQSVGASGAIFGIIGALLLLVIVHKGRLEQITITRLVFMILYSLYSGFVGSNINNAAHIGGFLSGGAAGLILWFLFLRNRERQKSIS